MTESTPTIDDAHQAIEQLIYRLDRVEHMLQRVAAAWADIDHNGRVTLGDTHPRLVDTLLDVAEVAR